MTKVTTSDKAPPAQSPDETDSHYELLQQYLDESKKYDNKAK